MPAISSFSVTTSDPWICPNCGLENIAERHICKRCRISLAQLRQPLLPPAATDTTGTLYISPDQHHCLLIVPQYLEYGDPGVTIRSTWNNIQSIRTDTAEDYLCLSSPAATKMILSGDAVVDAWMAQTIPLRCFGYPVNQSLLTNLQQFAPSLRKPEKGNRRR
jgi:hypothetical protein